jgi:hypothetical protein
MADGISIILRCFCRLYQELLPLHQNLIQDLEFFGNIRNFIPIQPGTIFPNNLMANLEDKSEPLFRRWPQGTASHVVVDWRTRGLKITAYTV